MAALGSSLRIFVYILIFLQSANAGAQERTGAESQQSTTKQIAPIAPGPPLVRSGWPLNIPTGTAGKSLNRPSPQLLMAWKSTESAASRKANAAAPIGEGAASQNLEKNPGKMAPPLQISWLKILAVVGIVGFLLWSIWRLYRITCLTSEPARSLSINDELSGKDAPARGALRELPSPRSTQQSPISQTTEESVAVLVAGAERDSAEGLEPVLSPISPTPRKKSEAETEPTTNQGVDIQHVKLTFSIDRSGDLTAFLEQTEQRQQPLEHKRESPRLSVPFTQTDNQDEDDDKQNFIKPTSRVVRVTGGNLRNYHLYIPLDFFPLDAIGGGNLTLAAPKKITVTFQPGETINTDVDGTKRILRNRSAIRNFFQRGGFEEGDLVHITRTGKYTYKFSKGLPNNPVEVTPRLPLNEIEPSQTIEGEATTDDVLAILGLGDESLPVVEEPPPASEVASPPSTAPLESIPPKFQDIASQTMDMANPLSLEAADSQEPADEWTSIDRGPVEDLSEPHAAQTDLTEGQHGNPSEEFAQTGISETAAETPQERPQPPFVQPPTKTWAQLGQKWKHELFGELLSRVGLEGPDGRPLYSYSVTPDDITALETFLARRLRAADPLQSTGAAFVFWAAEHIRARYPRPGERHLSWTFLFDAFGIPEEQNYARRLVQLGFSWWQRPVREAENGNNLYLFSLLVEGGLPEALLTQEGLYRRVILGLVEDVEREGGVRASPTVVAQIAERRLMALPQTFQSPDFIRLFVELGNALARLRAALPVDLPPESIEAWLAANRPNWLETLPLRASAEAIRRLIVPALQIERCAIDSGGPLVTRELRRDRRGHWHGYIRFAQEFWIPGPMLPDGADLRLRLVPGGALVKSEGAPSLFAAPERNGWRARLFGKTGPAVTRMDLSSPVVFTAFADGQSKGEIELDTGLPDPADAISLWRPEDGADAAAAETLTLSPSGRTRAPCLWALAPPDIRPSVDGGLALEGPQPVNDGQLWRVSGKGALIFGENRLSIETAAESDGEEARLVAFGRTLTGWKTARGRGLVFLGRPTLYGQSDTQAMTALADRNLVLKRSRGRTFEQYLAEWVENGETLSRLRYIALPSGFTISTRETAAGEARIKIDGLASDGLQISARAGDASAKATLSKRTYEIILKTVGAPAGEINLRISDPTSGTAIDLVAPWPARQAMLLDATGARLNRRAALAVESLGEIRAITPPGMSGGLNIALKGAPKMVLPVNGETSLGAHQAIVRALLAQGGADAQVDIWIEMGGLQQGPKLEVRRYADNAIVRGGILRAGLDRVAPPPPENAFSDALAPHRDLKLHAVDLKSGATQLIETMEPCNLHETLGSDGGPWLIQLRLDGRPQRAVFYSATPTHETTRDNRIVAFSRKFLALVQTPQDPAWLHVWKVIKALAEGGDAGCADQTQAFACAPEALVMLILKVERSALVMALELDLAAPIFWPSLPVEAFVTAILQYYAYRREAHLHAFDVSEAEHNAALEILRRVNFILARRPELAAHFGWALSRANLIHRAYEDTAPAGLRESLAQVRQSFPELAMNAARRFDSMPKGLKGIAPLNRPHNFDFHENTLAVVDAPVVTAEVAAGLRAVNKMETLQLIGLRLVDPEYFDAATPVALALVLEKAQCAAPA